MDRKALGTRLQSARKESGYTSERLAQKCSVSAVYIRQIESGKYQPSLSTLIKIGNVLHRSLDYFVQDSVDWNEIRALTEISQKCTPLNPQQIKMVYRMIDAMFDSTDSLS